MKNTPEPCTNDNDIPTFTPGQTVFLWDDNDLRIVAAEVTKARDGWIETVHQTACGGQKSLAHWPKHGGVYTTKNHAVDEALADLDRQIAALQALKKSIVGLHKSEGT